MPGHSTGVIRLIFSVSYIVKDFEIFVSANIPAMFHVLPKSLSYFLHVVVEQ